MLLLLLFCPKDGILLVFITGGAGASIAFVVTSPCESFNESNDRIGTGECVRKERRTGLPILPRLPPESRIGVSPKGSSSNKCGPPSAPRNSSFEKLRLWIAFAPPTPWLLLNSLYICSNLRFWPHTCSYFR